MTAPGQDGTVKEVEVHTYGLVHLFLLCDGLAGPVALAYIAHDCSRRDARGRYGVPDKCADMHAFSSFGGARRHLDVLSISDSVGCMARDQLHLVLFPRVAFSTVEG